MSTSESAGNEPQHTSDKTTAVTGNTANEVKQYPAVSEEEAKLYIKTWAEFNKSWETFSHDPKDYIRAYLIPISDIEAMYKIFNQQENIIGCRVYLGMEPVPQNTEPMQPGAMKLFMVPVAGEIDSNSGSDILYDKSTNKSLIYDFSLPCPSTCDIKSPLYQEEKS